MSYLNAEEVLPMELVELIMILDSELVQLLHGVFQKLVLLFVLNLDLLFGKMLITQHHFILVVV